MIFNCDMFVVWKVRKLKVIIGYNCVIRFFVEVIVVNIVWNIYIFLVLL